MFKDFFKRRKMRVVRYGEITAVFSTSHSIGEMTGQYSIIFFENDNGKREYIVKGSLSCYFDKTPYFTHCETWKHTGLLPEWAKDPVAEKLSR